MTGVGDWFFLVRLRLRVRVGLGAEDLVVWNRCLMEGGGVVI